MVTAVYGLGTLQWVTSDHSYAVHSQWPGLGCTGSFMGKVVYG